MHRSEVSAVSVRAQITLWNVVVIASALILFGLLLRYGVQRLLLASVDRELVARTTRPPHRGDGPGGPHGDGLRGGGPPDFRPPPDRPRGFPLPGPPPEGSFTRPRFFRDAALAPDGPPALSAAGLNEALRGSENFRFAQIHDDPLRVYSRPERDEQGRIIGAVQAGASLAAIHAAVDGVTLALLLGAPLVLLLTGAGAWLLTERALRPVGQMQAAVGQIQASDLAARLPVTSRDEFGQLATRLNQMLERLEQAFQRERRFVADASHELRTPLATITATTSLLLDDPNGPSEKEARTALTEIDRAADRAARLVRDLLLLARSHGDAGLPLQVETFALGALCADAVRDARNLHREQKVSATIKVQIAAEMNLTADRHHLHRLMVNLLDNALRHTPPGKTITVEARDENNDICLRIADTGEGIAAEQIARLGEPFYRPDSARTRRTGGAGLGLAIARSIVAAHGGSLEIKSEVGAGTVVTVHLPRRPAVTANRV